MALVYRAADGSEFPELKAYQRHVFQQHFRFVGRVGETLRKGPGEVNGNEFHLEDLEDCTVLVLDRMDRVVASNLRNCTIFLGPCAESVAIRKSHGCTVTCASKEVRVTSCSDCNVYAFSPAPVMLDDCSGINVGRFNGAYSGLTEHFEAVGLEPTAAAPSVTDFSARDKELPEPHFTIVEDAEPWAVQLDNAAGEPENPVLGGVEANPPPAPLQPPPELNPEPVAPAAAAPAVEGEPAADAEAPADEAAHFDEDPFAAAAAAPAETHEDDLAALASTDDGGDVMDAFGAPETAANGDDDEEADVGNDEEADPFGDAADPFAGDEEEEEEGAGEEETEEDPFSEPAAASASDDAFGGFEESAGEAVEPPAAPGHQDDDPFGVAAAPTAAAAEPALAENAVGDDDSALKAFEADFRERMAAKDQEGEKQRAHMREKAEEELDELYEERTQRNAVRYTSNREAEKTLVEDPTAGLDSWEKVVKLIDLREDDAKSERSMQRMRGLLVQLKSVQE